MIGIISGKKVFFQPDLMVQILVLDPFTKPLTDSSNLVYISHSVFHSLGKPEADLANSIALGFSTLITPDEYVKSKI